MALTLNLETQRSAGALALNLAPAGNNRLATIAGRTRTTGYGRLGEVIRATIAGRTRCRGAMNLAYDPNLLSAMHAPVANRWNDGALGAQTLSGDWNDSQSFPLIAAPPWQEATGAFQILAGNWQPAALLSARAAPDWQSADAINALPATNWNDALPLNLPESTRWGDALMLCQRDATGYQPRLPLLAPACAPHWNDGITLSYRLKSGIGDSAAIATGWATRWNEAGLAYNAWLPPRSRPYRPPIPTPPLELNLRYWREPGPLLLNLGATRPRQQVPKLRCYSVLNTCSVVRLPDRVALPVTAVTVSTDADSWGWNLSLTLLGAEGWALCQPASGMPREVEITINGLVWTGLLDDPQLSRKFGGHSISVNGKSRSGWLTTPFAPSATVSYDAPRTAQQVAEEILYSTGWSLDWQLPPDPNWLIPANHYARSGTPLERLTELVSAVKGGLYSDPEGYQLLAYPRYPYSPWNWESSPVDVAIPEAALLSWSQKQQYHPAVNRVYVSGTTAGCLLQLTMAGTAGDLCAQDPIVESLLTDSYAARLRAETELAAGGPGFEATVETLLGGAGAYPLVRPGLLCEFAGILGISRSCSITASRTADGLAVWQTLMIERRVGPWR